MALLNRGEADMSTPGTALSEERFKANKAYWPIYPQRITIAYARAAFPPQPSSSYSGLFPPQSTLVCLMVALVYNGFLLAKAKAPDSLFTWLFFHHRNFIVASLFYGVILKLLRSNLIIAFNTPQPPKTAFKTRLDVISALEAQSVRGLALDQVYIDTLLDPLPSYRNYSPEFARLIEAAKTNKPKLAESLKTAVQLLKKGDNEGRKYILVGGEEVYMSIRQFHCGIAFAFFDVSPPNSEGVYFGKDFRPRIHDGVRHEMRLTREYARIIWVTRDRLLRRFQNRNCPPLQASVPERLLLSACQSIFVILAGIYGFGCLLLGAELIYHANHFTAFWVPESLTEAQRPFGSKEWLGFRPISTRPVLFLATLPGQFL